VSSPRQAGSACSKMPVWVATLHTIFLKATRGGAGTSW
jgi:hypothetical protein